MVYLPGLTDGARVAVLHGDDALVSHVEPFPRDKDTTPTARDHRDRHQAALWHALALGGVNGRASDELDRIRNTLSTTMRDMCETRGLEVPEFRRRPMPLLVIEAEVARPTDRFDIDSAPPAPGRRMSALLCHAAHLGDRTAMRRLRRRPGDVHGRRIPRG